MVTLLSNVGDVRLLLTIDSDARLHVIIQDAAQQVYQVPETVLPRPSGAFESPDDHELGEEYRKLAMIKAKFHIVTISCEAY